MKQPGMVSLLWFAFANISLLSCIYILKTTTAATPYITHESIFVYEKILHMQCTTR